MWREDNIRAMVYETHGKKQDNRTYRILNSLAGLEGVHSSPPDARRVQHRGRCLVVSSCKDLIVPMANGVRQESSADAEDYCLSPLLAKKLRIVVRGANLTSDEGEKTEPRDILFELETAALFKSWQLPVQLGQSADLSFEYNGVPVLCECKRVQTPKAFGRNLQVADSQLRNALKEI